MAHTFAPFREEALQLPARPSVDANVSGPERIGSAAVGAALAAYGAVRRDLPGLLLGLAGGLLILRGATGQCACYRSLGIDTAQTPGRGVPGNSGIRLEKTIEIQRPPMELYYFWHDLPNLPEVMPHVKSVTLDGARSHWVVAGPLGRNIEWDAEFINETPGELIAWQSLPGAQVRSAGSVRFEPLNDGNATLLRVVLEYLPPAGKPGALVAAILGASPEKELEIDLERFKQRMESASAVQS